MPYLCGLWRFANAYKNSKIERNHIATEGGEARMKKIKQFLVMLLVISLSITSLGSTVFAAGDFSSET